MPMNATAPTMTVALAVILPAHALVICSLGAVVLLLLVYFGIALPAVWSAKPARRKAAAAVLCQVLNALAGRSRQ